MSAPQSGSAETPSTTHTPESAAGNNEIATRNLAYTAPVGAQTLTKELGSRGPNDTIATQHDVPTATPARGAEHLVNDSSAHDIRRKTLPPQKIANPDADPDHVARPEAPEIRNETNESSSSTVAPAGGGGVSTPAPTIALAGGGEVAEPATTDKPLSQSNGLGSNGVGTGLTAVDLCSGCGGIAHAIRSLQFQVVALYENNARNCATLTENGFDNVVNSPIESVDFTTHRGVTLLTAGLPCQPFSIGGKHHGEADSRNLWEHATRAVEEAKPYMFMFETVSGFLSPRFRNLREKVCTQLTSLGYRVQLDESDAKDHGLAQRRKRCIITGHKCIGCIHAPQPLPSVTIEDAIKDLGEPDGSNWHEKRGSPSVYPGHIPSQIEGQARTVLAGCHGPGGGNNTLVDHRGQLRYFTIRELARLQGFPDAHVFDSGWSQATSQLGNACPVPMAERWLYNLAHLLTSDQTQHAEAITQSAQVLLRSEGRQRAEASEDPKLAATVAAATGPSDNEPDSTEGDSNCVSDPRRTITAELARRGELVRILQAQVSVLYMQYCRLGSQLKTDQGCEGIDQYCQQLATELEKIEHVIGPSRREAMIAAAQLVKEESKAPSPKYIHRTGQERSRQVARAVDNALLFAKLKTELDREQQLCSILRLSDIRASGDEDGPTVGDQEYFDSIDSDLKDNIVCPEEAKGYQKIEVAAPRHLLTEPDEDPETGLTDFFDNASILAVEEAMEKEGKYESMKATLPIVDSNTGDEADIISIVDSGAAWCAMKLSVLEDRLPSLVKKIRGSRMKFRDASNNRMSLVGRVPITIRIGTRTIRTVTYVFRELGADFLLGANALRQNGCLIDCHRNRLYVHDDANLGVATTCSPCTQCSASLNAITEDTDETVEKERAEEMPSMEKPCPSCHGHYRVVCDKDKCRLNIEETETDQCGAFIACTREVHKSMRLTLMSDITLPWNQPVMLDPLLTGVPKDYRAPTLMHTCPGLLAVDGLQVQEAVTINPTGVKCPFMVTNQQENRKPLVMKKGTTLAVGRPGHVRDSDCVTIAAVLESPKDVPEDSIRPLSEGGKDDLAKLGFSLDKAIDPEKRLADGSYAPLSEEKKEILFIIAHRWHHVWSRDAKVPKISYLVVMEIPTGDASPQQQAPYPIPARLRKAVMEEITKLLKAGLIEPSMSDWASPALVTVKKDSTATELKIKLAIDYRRVNAVTRLDAGGLGTQSDILNGLSGKYKFMGLADAAGGFYQYLLSPADRGKSAFILPAAMGGTLFQWRVAPYGLTRNPAGYSRGMQWILKGLHECEDLGGSGRAGAVSWLDDICMRATTFEGFCELFELVLLRLATAGMTLKGSKCELLHATLDVLGFIATPHGLMNQAPKLDKLMENGIPTSPKAADSFLGAVAFLRRMVPRMSLLGAPMTKACLSCRRRYAPKKVKGQKPVRRREGPMQFSEEEQDDVNQAWQAIMDQLDKDQVLSTPDFDDPNAEFIICTDASDYAIGGVLMQWQHEDDYGPGPPVNDQSAQKAGDPLDSKWRKAAGWKIKIIGFYSKTLDDAQRNYPAFDKEAGAILMCVRHWADIITYHPTSVYTDSSVATSMLVKHIAPPRLQRWGIELGTYLPHLKISYRKGADNGLADLLSRFPAFGKFVKVRNDIAVLPDDLFDHVGDAPLYTRTPSGDREYLKNAVYQLYEPKRRTQTPEEFWSDKRAPEIPGRGMKDRAPHVSDGQAVGETSEDGNGGDDTGDTELGIMAVTCVQESKRGDRLAHILTAVGQDIDHRRTVDTDAASLSLQSVQMFLATCSRRPTLQLLGRPEACTRLADEADEAGFELTSESSKADIIVHIDSPRPNTPTDCVALGLASRDKECTGYVTIEGVDYGVHADAVLELPPTEPVRGTHAPCVRARMMLGQALSELLHRRYGQVVRPDSRDVIHSAMLEEWATHGYGSRPHLRSLNPQPMTGSTETGTTDPMIAGVDEDNEPGTQQGTRTKARTFSWEDGHEESGETGAPILDKDIPPTVTITLDDQLKDPVLRPLIEALRGSTRVSKRIRERALDKFQLETDCLYWRTLRDGEPALAKVVPQTHRPAILSLYHYSLADGAGHAGGQCMYDQIRVSYYWDDMERECHAFVGACERCGGTRSQATIPVPSGIAPTPARPFEVIHIDHKGPMSISKGYTHVLAVVCALTRFTLYIPVASLTGEVTLAALRDYVFNVFGHPLVIISDNGSSFANKLMAASENLYGYRHIFVMPHTPQANGLAEAAVKKLKIILDRHTEDYANWKPLLSQAQAIVNMRISSGINEVPFTALFGRAPPTLAALENPELLPNSSPEERIIRNFAESISRLQTRLKAVSDEVKRARVAADTTQPARRRVQPGDKVWLTYSDGERSRYLRKHGHGAAWRHAFVVDKVKPHAVRVIIPTDGSVPNVLPWQSLRKCSFAAPHFHDQDMPIPEVGDHGLPTIANEDADGTGTSPAESPVGHLADPMGWATWTATQEYEIERIVSGKRIGRGWTFQVKWKGYPETTPEAYWKLMRDAKNNPDILAEIEQCKDDYLAAYPSERTVIEAEERLEADTAPERTQPVRQRAQPERFTFAVFGANDPLSASAMISARYGQLRDDSHKRCAALRQLLPDYFI